MMFDCFSFVSPVLSMPSDKGAHSPLIPLIHLQASEGNIVIWFLENLFNIE